MSSYVKRRTELFFSLAGFHNDMFTSNDPEKIIEFLNGFSNRESLVQWMKDRPKGRPYIHEVEGEKKVIVVIPTADFNGKFAKECRENVFKGLHIVFVESGAPADFYFNFSHYVNAGIKKAMEYNPNWIVVAGDDMRKIDDPEILVEALSKIDPLQVQVVFTKSSPDRYHSKPAYFGRPNFLGKMYLSWIRHTRLAPYDFWIYLHKWNGLIEKFGINVILLPRHFVSKIFFTRIKPVILTMSLSIFSCSFVKSEKCNVFNETFINGAEDWDLCWRIFRKGISSTSIQFIDYEIGEQSGGTLGTGGVRAIRDIANVAYFNLLYENDFK